MRFITIFSGVLLILSVSLAEAGIEGVFSRSDVAKFDHSYQWAFDGKVAAKGGSSGGIWYRLQIAEDSISLHLGDSHTNSLTLSSFAVDDVLLDGNRLRVFQRCLVSQQRHSRFLQQGLLVKNGLCTNNGESGELVIKIDAQERKRLLTAKRMTFVIHPYRKEVRVEFSIDDYVSALNKIEAEAKKKLVLIKLQEQQSKPEPVKVMPTVRIKTCRVKPPKEYRVIRAIKYVCSEAIAKTKAIRQMKQMVFAEKRQRLLLAEEKARHEKQLAEEASRRQQAITESKARQAEMNKVIFDRMIKACKKSWESGRSRCYCEKYLEYAPPHIKSNPSCHASKFMHSNDADDASQLAGSL